MIIAIAGGKGAGKSTLAHALADAWGDGAEVFGMDPYWIPRAHWQPSTRDDPGCLDAGRLWEDMQTRQRPALLIIEGLLALRYAFLRAVSRHLIWIDCSPETRLYRRLWRDCVDYQLCPEAMLREHVEADREFFWREVAPTREYATLILDGERCRPEEAAAQVLKVIRN